MPRTIHFHLDEHVDGAIASGLRRLGIDVTTTLEGGLLGASDPDHLRFALPQDRVTFTQDHDFLRLNAQNVPHAGIAYCAPGIRSIGEIIRGLELIWAVLEPQDMQDHVEFI